MNANDDKRIAEIRERCEKATPGEWSVGNPSHKDYGGGVQFWSAPIHVGSESTKGNCFCTVSLGGDGAINSTLDAVKGNAEFIANARSDIPFLLQHILAIEAQLEEAQATLSCSDYSSGKANPS